MEELSMIFNEMNKRIQNLKERSKDPWFDKGELAAVYTMRGMQYCQVQSFEKSITDFDESIEIIECMSEEGKQRYENVLAISYAGRGTVLHAIGETNRALQDLTMSINIWEGMLGSDRYIDEGMMFNSYIHRGNMLNTTYEYADVAILDYQKSIIIAERLEKSGETYDEDSLATAHMGIGVSYDQKEDYDEANKHYDKCIAIWERLQEEKQELTYDNLASSYMNRGSNLYQMGYMNKSIADHNQSVSIREHLMEKGVEQDAFDVFMAYKNRSLPFEVTGNIRAAINDNIKALGILKNAFSDRYDLHETYYENLGETIELIVSENDKALYATVLQDFLYDMRAVQKTEEAETAQNRILAQID